MSISDIVSAPPLRLRRPAPHPHRLLPRVAGGQIWLVEATAAKAPPSAPAQHALDSANVVIYDRSLGGRLAVGFPLGTYAEPAPDADGTGAVAAARCVRFARDGWSVVRLLPPRPAQRERLRRVREIVRGLTGAGAPGSLPVRVLAEATYGIRDESETRLDRLADTVATYDRDTRLAIVIDAFAEAAAAPPLVAANGLAG